MKIFKSPIFVVLLLIGWGLVFIGCTYGILHWYG
jgi:hypothetical protein